MKRRLEPIVSETPSGVGATYVFFALACAITWLLATPLSLAWYRHEPQSGFAVACAGLSAFGPLLAAVLVANRADRRETFGRWRTSAGWVLLSLIAAPAIHVAASAVFVAFGGHVERWLHPPATSEALAALVVFPIGEEFGWRGFAYPKLAVRFGPLRGSLALGLVWGLWHLAYSVTPEHGRFEFGEFALGMLELPLYSVLITWVFERANRSMAVAIAFHAGAHLDHLERVKDASMMLHAAHIVVLAVLAALAVRAKAQPFRGGLPGDTLAGIP